MRPVIIGGEPISKEIIPVIQPTTPKLEEIKPQLDYMFENARLSNNGKFIKDFETKLSYYLGADSIGVSNATLGLMITLKALNLKGEVIVPSFTFPATAHILEWNNLSPVFVDIDKETYNIDPTEVERALKENNNISAIIAVNVFGNPCDISALEELASKFNVKLIFDSAHAFGATYKNKKIGNFGDVEIFSTHATKILITGEGGIISSKNKELLKKIKELGNFGYTETLETYDTKFCGINTKMQEFSAILGLWNLNTISNLIQNRNFLAQRYIHNLQDINGLSFQKTNTDSERVHLFFSIVIDKNKFGLNRDELAQALKLENILTKKYFYPPLHKQTAYKNHNSKLLINTEVIADNILCLPLYSHMTREEVDLVCTAIKRIHDCINKSF